MLALSALKQAQGGFRWPWATFRVFMNHEINLLKIFFPLEVYMKPFCPLFPESTPVYTSTLRKTVVFLDSPIFQYFLMTAHPEWFLDPIFRLFQYPGRLITLGLVIRLASQPRRQQHDG